MIDDMKMHKFTHGPHINRVFFTYMLSHNCRLQSEHNYEADDDQTSLFDQHKHTHFQLIDRPRPRYTHLIVISFSTISSEISLEL